MIPTWKGDKKLCEKVQVLGTSFDLADDKVKHQTTKTSVKRFIILHIVTIIYIVFCKIHVLDSLQ